MKHITRKGSRILWMTLFLLFAGTAVCRATPYIPVTVTCQEAPAQIKLSWPSSLKNGTVIQISKKLLTSEGNSWSTPVEVTVPNPYLDTNVEIGTIYEYKLYAPSTTAYAYVCSGIKAPLVENRGKLLLITDNTISGALSNELNRLEGDLTGDGWTVIRKEFDRHGTGKPADLKAYIKSEYTADPTEVKSVLLFGHLPIQKSGWQSPDGHYTAPRATDSYYGDMIGNWTDSTVNQTGTTYSNVKDDGNLDQNTLPATTMTLEVGRVDLSGMPSFISSEIDLLKKYLDKDHSYRMGSFDVPDKGIIYNGELMGVCSSISQIVGNDNIEVNSKWFPSVSTQKYLWAGGMHSCDVADLAKSPTYAVFTALFGSHYLNFGDNDNKLRAIIASSPYALSSCWGGRPDWYFHHMSMGKTLGYSARRSQQNAGEYYPSAYSFLAKGVWMALMGDPSLRIDPIRPPSDFHTEKTPDGSVALRWQPSPENGILGYNIFRSEKKEGPFEKLNSALTEGCSFVDSSPLQGDSYYMLRAVRLEQSTTGSYYNASSGIYAQLSATGTQNQSPTVTDISLKTTANDRIYFKLSGQDAEGDSFGYHVSGLPSHGNVRSVSSSNSFCYTPDDGFSGTDSFPYVGYDQTSSGLPATVTIVVEPQPPEPPSPELRVTAVNGVFNIAGRHISLQCNFSAKATEDLSAIVRNPSAEVVAIGQARMEDAAAHSFEIDLPETAQEGQYQYQASLGSSDALAGTFYYGEPEKLTVEKACLAGGIISGNLINPSDTAENGTLIAAAYQNGKLVTTTSNKMSCGAFSDVNPFSIVLWDNESPMPDEYEVKLYFWDSLQRLRPIAQTLLIR